MGCGNSKLHLHHALRHTIDETWHRAMATVDRAGEKQPRRHIVIRDRTWIAVRLYVCSSYKDFAGERKYVMEQVLPKLKIWCRERKLEVVDCDLRFGLPDDARPEDLLRTAMNELDRCRECNVCPFFLCFLGRRIGWIPKKNEVPPDLESKYEWIRGFSMIEMEIMHGAYRLPNPNALFLIRDDTFLHTIPQDIRHNFIDGNPIADDKINRLKYELSLRFQDEQIATYACLFDGYSEDKKDINLRNLDQLGKLILDFVKHRLDEQYPIEGIVQDRFALSELANENFVNNLAPMVIGRDEVIDQILDKALHQDHLSITVVHCPSGYGKTAMLADMLDVISQRPMCNCGAKFHLNLPTKTIDDESLLGRDAVQHCRLTGRYRIFKHFVSPAIPNSADGFHLLQRLHAFLEEDQDMTDMDETELAATVCCSLSKPVHKPRLLILDDLEKIDSPEAFQSMRWLPPKLSANYKFIMTATSLENEFVCAVKDRTHGVAGFELPPLQKAFAEELAEKALAYQGYTLAQSVHQPNIGLVKTLVNVMGRYPGFQLEQIMPIPDLQVMQSLADLVLDQIEKDPLCIEAIAVLCLLHCSASDGLLEGEIRNLVSAHMSDLTSVIKINSDESLAVGDIQTDSLGHLPAFQWSLILGVIKPFVAHAADPSKLTLASPVFASAVKRRYLSSDTAEQWFNAQLADHFQKCEDTRRRAEELPKILINCNEMQLAQQVLAELPVFYHYVSEYWNYHLLDLWTQTTQSNQTPSRALTSLYQDSLQEAMDNLQSPMAESDISRMQWQLCRLFYQNGSYSESKNLLTELIKSYENSSTATSTAMLYRAYLLRANITEQGLERQPVPYHNALDTLETMVRDLKSALDCGRVGDVAHDKAKQAHLLRRIGTHYSSMAQRLSIGEDAFKRMCHEANSALDESDELYREVGDEIGLTEVALSIGGLSQSAYSKQLASYNQAENVFEYHLGSYSPRLAQIYLLKAALYEMIGVIGQASRYFHKRYRLLNILYGAQDARTRAAFYHLASPIYQKLDQVQADENELLQGSEGAVDATTNGYRVGL